MKWDVLKAYVLPVLTTIDAIDYLRTLTKLFKNKDVMSSCSDVLHIIELLITPISNAKLERMFKIKDFDPDCYISMWYPNKV